MAHNGRVSRLIALALATGTLVAAGAGTAGAATSSASAADTIKKSVFTATGGGSVIHLVLNLPVAVPGVGTQLTQDLIMTGSTVRTSGLTSKAAGMTQAVLGANGNVPLVSDVLKDSVVNEFGKPQTGGKNAFPAGLPITGELLALNAVALNPDSDATSAHAISKVANLRLEGAGNLQAVLDALVAQITSTLTGVIGTMPSGAQATDVAGVTTTVTDLLGSVVDQLNTATDGAAQPVVDAVDLVIAQLNALPQLLSAKLKATAADTSLLHVGLLESEQTVSRSAGVVTSKATNTLTNIGLLGDLVTVTGLRSSATASLGDKVSSAAPKAIGDSSLLKVNLANLLTVDVTGDLTAALGGDLVPAEVRNAVNTALATITTALNGALGATLVGPKVGKSVENKDEASTVVNGASLRVQPVGFAKPLVELSLVPATAKVTRAIQAQGVTRPTVVSLPRTGADLPLTGAVATALLGLALVARRRRLAQL